MTGVLASVAIGHWTGEATGVTVLIPPPGTMASGEVRGGAPATREFALLDPAKMMDRIDAVVLSGGSAFGLAVADGVMQLLYERGMGFTTWVGPVPIVVGMSIFDGAIGPAAPGAEEGRLAAQAALEQMDAAAAQTSGEAGAGETSVAVARGGAGAGETGAGETGVGVARGGAAGNVGAGKAATTGKWRMQMSPGGFGWSQRQVGEATLAAVAVVNAFGDIIGADGKPVFEAGEAASAHGGIENTTIVVVMTDVALSKMDCHLLAQSGHNGLARALNPVHTRFDGDAVVALATGVSKVEADVDALRAATAEVVSEAIRNSVGR